MKSALIIACFFLSTFLLFSQWTYDWLGEQQDNPSLVSAAKLMQAAVDAAFETGKLLPAEFGGSASTADIAAAVCEGVDRIDLAAA